MGLDFTQQIMGLQLCRKAPDLGPRAIGSACAADVMSRVTGAQEERHKGKRKPKQMSQMR